MTVKVTVLSTHIHCYTYKWDEGYIGDNLMENAQKFGDLIVSMTDRDDNIDESVDNLRNYLLIYLCESKFKDKCENCIQSHKKRRYYYEYKPWFTEDCNELDKQYLKSLDELNKNHSNEIRHKLNVAKQKYKVTENKLKRQYQNQQGHMMNTLRRKNPNKFYRKFKRVKKQIYSDITIEQF